jgi:hypothetical protein
LLGFDSARDGAALLEIWAGHDAPLAIPPSLASLEERSIDRWLGKVPAALVEVFPADISREELARIVAEAVALRAAVPLVEAALPADLERERFQPIETSTDPIPPGARAGVLMRVPIGWIEAAALDPELAQGRVWIGGDILTARWLLDELGGSARPSFDAVSAPLMGATLADLIEVVQRARSSEV